MVSSRRWATALLSAAGMCWMIGASAPAFADKPVTVAFALSDLSNDWKETCQRDMQEHVKAAGWKLISTSADNDPAKQLSDIQNLLAQSPSVIVVSPIESVALAPAVQMANDAGVPMIVIDRKLSVAPGTGEYKVAIVQSHAASGKLLAEKTVELLKAKYGKPKGNVVRLAGIPGASTVADARAGWDSVMKNYPDIKVIASPNAQFTKEGGIKAMQDLLQRYPKGSIDVVWSDYSDETMGAIQVIKAAGRTELLGNIVGEGGQIQAIEAVTRGEIARETQTPPYFGQDVVDNVKKLLAGQKVQPEQGLQIQVFDADKKDQALAYLKSIQAKGLKF
ncbi:substrate-binding domain-containing protein [Paraburkholderia sp. B3]|uniref:substrate-binding domain-containing protein n=1 Tax=Paraburkholderia sp. B3 TaxID=3134791 RepID=UPI003981E3E9